MQRGQAQCSSKANGSTTTHVAFSPAFPQAPTVMLQLNALIGDNSSAGAVFAALTFAVCNVTAQGFDVRISNGESSTAAQPVVDWIAVL